MELRHLRYFIAVAEYENVRVASARLHVTQPAVSRQIHDLETELQVALFDRTPRGLKLTPAGEAFLRSARDAFSVIEEGVRAARRNAGGNGGLLRIGVVESAAWDGLVPATFDRLRREVPGMSIQLSPGNTPSQLAAIQAGGLDGGFVFLFDPLPDGLEAISLAKHDVVLAVPSDWVAVLGSSVLARQLMGQPFVMFQRQIYPAYYDRLVRLCSQSGLTLRLAQEVSGESAALSLVSAGLGIAIVNGANRNRPPARVRFVDVTDLSVPLPLSFVYPSKNSNPALHRFISAAHAVSSELRL